MASNGDKRDVILSAPMSFVGSARRLTRGLWSNRGLLFRILFGWWLLLTLMMIAWVVIAAWYLTFGIFLIPYRLVRRGSRKRKREDLMHADLISAIADRQEPQLGSRSCPFCAEEVRQEAVLCRHCGSDISGDDGREGV